MALFKIYNNIDSQNALPDTYTKGYMYFDATKSLFYIDTAGEGGNTGIRTALNAYGAQKAYADENDNRISTTYATKTELQEASTKPLGHKLIFGAGQTFIYDGSEDVTVPVYTGSIA